MSNESKNLPMLQESKQEFAMALTDAINLDIVNNVAGAFDAAIIVARLEAVLTDEVMEAVFMPLMNKKIGFLTDHDPNRPRNGVAPKPYSVAVVRTCIIDAASMGLKPTGNQFNIIAERTYPTKEGFTALLKNYSNQHGLKYIFQFDSAVQPQSTPEWEYIPCVINYQLNGETQKPFKYVASVNKKNGANVDQMRGKAERKCKRAFYEYLTGNDLGDADADTVDVSYTEVKPSQTAKSAAEKAREMMEKRKAEKEATTAQSTATGGIQPNINFDDMSDEEVEKMWENNGEGVQQ